MIIKASGYLLILSVISAPLLFGLTDYWAVAVVLGLLLASLFLIRLGDDGKGKCKFPKVPGLVILIIIFVYGLLQLIPIPASLLKIISYNTWKVHSLSTYSLEQGAWMPLSISPRETLLFLMNMTGCVTVYILTIYHFSHYKNLENYLKIIAYFAGGYSLLSIFQFLIPDKDVFWFVREWPLRTSHHFGTYVNGNHYAGAMEMLLPIFLSLFLLLRPKIRYESFKNRFVEFFSSPRVSNYVILGFISLLTAVSVFFSLSRGGILSTLFSLGIFALLIAYRKKEMNIRYIVPAIVVLFLFIGVIGWNPIFDRFDLISSEIQNGRSKIWSDSLEIIADYPIFGTGFESYMAIYPSYQKVFGNMIVDHAHNDYIEVLTDSGVIGLILYFMFLFTVMRYSFRLWKNRNNKDSIYIWAGATSGVAAILSHSITDFNMHIYGNKLLLFFIIGVMVASSSCDSHYREERLIEDMSCTKAFITKYSLMLLLFLGVIGYSGASFALLYTSLSSDKSLHTMSKTNAEKEKALWKTAVFLDPLNSKYQSGLGNIEVMLNNSKGAFNAYRKAVSNDPANGENLQMIALAVENKNNFQLTNDLLKNGIKLDIGSDDRYYTYSSWLFSRGKSADGVRIVKEILTLHPNATQRFLILMILHKLDNLTMDSAFPDMAVPLSIYGDYQKNIGNNQKAEELYIHAVQLNQKEKNITSGPYWRLYNFYRERELYENAISILRQAAENFPNDANIRGNIGYMYEKAGITYKAIEEYRIALVINPNQKWIRDRLNLLEKYNK